MKFLGEVKELEICIDICGFSKVYPEVEVTLKKGFSGIKIYGENNKYTVEYTIKTDFLRAVTLLSGLIKRGESNIKIEETRKLDSCGVMIDCSRNAVPKIETLKDVFVRMAKMGLMESRQEKCYTSG